MANGAGGDEYLSFEWLNASQSGFYHPRLRATRSFKLRRHCASTMCAVSVSRMTGTIARARAHLADKLERDRPRLANPLDASRS